MDRIIISISSKIKSIVTKELNKNNSNKSKFIREKITDIVNKNKKIYIHNFASINHVITNTKSTDSITIKINKDIKKDFRQLIKNGTMGAYIKLKLLEFILFETEKEMCREEIKYFQEKVYQYVSKYEDDEKIVYLINNNEKRIDIYLEQEIKDKYIQMIKKLGIEYNTHLRYFIKKAIKENKKICSSKVVSGKRNSQLTITINEMLYNKFKSLFDKKSSISSYFRNIIIEELIKNGYIECSLLE